MALPSKTQISDAVENASSFIALQLKGYQAESGILGPNHYSGGFCIVFPINNGQRRKALRVWHTEIYKIKERYKLISNDIARANMSFLSNVEYVENGLQVGEEYVNIVLMDWLDGLSLKQYIDQVISSDGADADKKNKLVCLANHLLHVFQQMHTVHFAHGDLQHDNIIVQPNGDVKLIDYDNFSSPALQNKFEQTTTGYSGYQHPQRRYLSHLVSSEKDDYFAELVIYLSLLSIAEDFSLWNIAKDDDFALLLTNDDFIDIQHSNTFNALKRIEGEISLLCQILEDYIKTSDLTLLEPFDIILGRMTNEPEIHSFSATSDACLKGDTVQLLWDIENYTQVLLNGKDVTADTHIEEIADLQTTYTLEVVNYQKRISASIHINIFPRPVISFSTDKKKLHKDKGEMVTLTWNVQNAEQCSLIAPDGTNENCEPQGAATIIPAETSTYIFRTLALDKRTVVDTPITISVYPDAQVEFASDKGYTFPSIPFTLSWQVRYAKRVTLNGKLVKATDTITYDSGIETDTTYVLRVTDEFGEKDYPLTIKMLPIPQIKTILIPTPHVSENVNITTNVPTPTLNIHFPQPRLHHVELLDMNQYNVHIETDIVPPIQLITPCFELKEQSLFEKIYNKLNKILKHNGNEIK